MVRRVDALAIHAGVDGASDAVVAIERRADAIPCGAMVRSCAVIAVVAQVVVVGMLAAKRIDAHVVGANVPVLARNRVAAVAYAGQAEVVERANVVVVAGQEVVEVVGAAGGGRAAIGRADVVVVAVPRSAALANAAGAEVHQGAGVPVVARSALRAVRATGSAADAHVQRARIVVVALGVGDADHADIQRLAAVSGIHARALCIANAVHAHFRAVAERAVGTSGAVSHVGMDAVAG